VSRCSLGITSRIRPGRFADAVSLAQDGATVLRRLGATDVDFHPVVLGGALNPLPRK
jgi:hypothetical protein